MSKYSKLALLFYIGFVFNIVTFLPYCVAEQGSITPEEASEYVGQTRTVCGKVASTKYAMGSRGSPTFLNLDKPYPNHIFTVVIWGKNRDKFENPPETFYNGGNICVTGSIATYRGKPQIEVDDPSQIEMKTN